LNGTRVIYDETKLATNDKWLAREPQP